MKLEPKNWREFQHYKNRNPPWIKLQKTLLDNIDFHRLPVASRALAPMLWLLASESENGVFEGDYEELAFRLRTTEKEVVQGLKPLIDKGFFIVTQDASNTLAQCLQDAMPEKRREETETERLAAFVLPDWIPGETWAAYLKTRSGKKAKNEPHALGLIVADLETFRSKGYDAKTVLDNSIKGGWAGVFEPKSAPSSKQESFV